MEKAGGKKFKNAELVDDGEGHIYKILTILQIALIFLYRSPWPTVFANRPTVIHKLISA